MSYTALIIAYYEEQQRIDYNERMRLKRRLRAAQTRDAMLRKQLAAKRSETHDKKRNGSEQKRDQPASSDAPQQPTIQPRTRRIPARRDIYARRMILIEKKKIKLHEESIAISKKKIDVMQEHNTVLSRLAEMLQNLLPLLPNIIK